MCQMRRVAAYMDLGVDKETEKEKEWDSIDRVCAWLPAMLWGAKGQGQTSILPPACKDRWRACLMLPKCCAASAHLQHSIQSTSPLSAVHGETPPPADKYPARKCNCEGATSSVCRARRGVVQRVGLSPRKTSLYLARGGAAPPAAAIFSFALNTQKNFNTQILL